MKCADEALLVGIVYVNLRSPENEIKLDYDLTVGAGHIM